jgi:hypothetical protein
VADHKEEKKNLKRDEGFGWLSLGLAYIQEWWGGSYIAPCVQPYTGSSRRRDGTKWQGMDSRVLLWPHSLGFPFPVYARHLSLSLAAATPVVPLSATELYYTAPGGDKEQHAINNRWWTRCSLPWERIHASQLNRQTERANFSFPSSPCLILLPVCPGSTLDVSLSRLQSASSSSRLTDQRLGLYYMTDRSRPFRLFIYIFSKRIRRRRKRTILLDILFYFFLKPIRRSSTSFFLRCSTVVG